MQATVTVSKGRLIAFRVIAVLWGLITLVFTLPGAVFTWFDRSADSIHHIHLVAGLGFGLLGGVALLLSAWKPDAQVSAFQAALAMAVAAIVAGLLGGDFVAGGAVIQVVVVAVLLTLHSDRAAVLRVRAPDPRLALIPALSLIPAVAYAITQARLQRNGIDTDPHVEMHHYSGMAWVAVGLGLCGIVAAMRSTGWRFPLWAAGVAIAALGFASLAFPDYPSVFATAWAWAAIAGGLAMIAIGEWVRRREPSWP